MQSSTQKDKELVIKLNTEELNSTQIRLIKSVNALLIHVIAAEDEAEYFETSANLLKKAAELIRHSSYVHQNKDMSYGDQAVEFAVDFLNESLDQKFQNIDN
jgi:hypothetical protein